MQNAAGEASGLPVFLPAGHAAPTTGPSKTQDDRRKTKEMGSHRVESALIQPHKGFRELNPVNLAYPDVIQGHNSDSRLPALRTSSLIDENLVLHVRHRERATPA